MEIALAYRTLIDSIVAWSGSANLMHVHAGLAIFLLVQVVVRDRRGSMVALHAVFALEMMNEAMDWLAPSPWWSLRDTLSDILLTMMWPVAITAVGHYRRRRWQKAADALARAQRWPVGVSAGHATPSITQASGQTSR